MTSAGQQEGLLVVGSLWIIYDMNANMLPMTRPMGVESRDLSADDRAAVIAGWRGEQQPVNDL